MPPAADERYVLLTTYRRDGRPVATPVWWAEFEPGKFGFWTSSTTGKAKRLRQDDRAVTVQPCNARGVVKPGSEATAAKARLATAAELTAIRTAIVAKYGFQTKITKLMAQAAAALRGKRLPYADTGIVVTL